MVMPILVSPAPYPGVSGSPFGAANNIKLAAGASQALARGWHLVTTTADDTVVLNTSATTSVTILAISATGWVFSDGTNVEVKNGGTADTGNTVDYALLAS